MSKDGTRRRPPGITWRKVGMTSSPHGLYVQGYTRATMDGTKRSKPARGSQSQKTVLSSDCRLQLACMKLESLVMADPHAAVNKSEEHTSELQSLAYLVCRLLLEKK